MLTATVQITGDRWAEVEAALLERLSGVVTQTADNVAVAAQGFAPVRTGALRDSIEAQPVDALNATVEVGVDYGIYVELGTHKMAPQPFLSPAADLIRPQFEADVEKALQG